MFARLLATVAALLLACSSPQANAYARAEPSVSLAVLATPALKTALPARARAGNPATGQNPAVSYCRVYKILASAPECASAHNEYANNNPYTFVDPDGRAVVLLLAAPAAVDVGTVAITALGVAATGYLGAKIVQAVLANQPQYNAGAQGTEEAQSWFSGLIPAELA